MRLGLFGGSFDPPHVGHLLVASDAFDLLGLGRLVFIPAAQQPLKLGRAGAPPEARLQMLREMVGGDQRFSVDAAEIERGGLSYTVDTLQWYADHHAEDERFFFVGVDAWQHLEAWREPARVLSLARLALLARSAGNDAVPTEEMLRQRVRTLGGSGALTPVLVNARRIDVSSTEIRARVRDGRPIGGYVVESVARYIEDSGLYR